MSYILTNSRSLHLVAKPTITPEIIPDSEHVIKTVPLGHGLLGSRTTQAALRNPLRRIVARFPVYELVWNDEHEIVYYLDSLECGHQLVVYPQVCTSGQKRHQCIPCGEQKISVEKVAA